MVSLGSFHGNASNVFRVWAAVKEGEIPASESPDGKKWQQVSFVCPGINLMVQLLTECLGLIPVQAIFEGNWSRGGWHCEVDVRNDRRRI